MVLRKLAMALLSLGVVLPGLTHALALREVKTKLDGVSLKNVLEGNSKPVHDYLYFELGFARGVATKDWKYITVRYDEKTQNKIDNGVLFKGWNNTEIKLPYYLSNGHLGHQAALHNPFYFEKNLIC